MLVAMAGLPGSGKSTVAEELARELGCALLSVDPIEAAMWRAGVDRAQPTGLAAYVVAEAVAREQLVLGNAAIIDAVNDVEPARQQWVALAAELGVPLAFVEVVCSDADEHRRRLAERQRGIDGFPEPTWESVLERSEAFRAWQGERLRVDSMRPLGDNVAVVREHLAQLAGDRHRASERRNPRRSRGFVGGPNWT
ncbi:AAA family ATPase [Aestuariimicrobium soli]|uniref:AAA family ATPase n=1 Tax=Aestuariimicrobium soli TaxID=2035834 RepID=UPI003EB7FCDE